MEINNWKVLVVSFVLIGLFSVYLGTAQNVPLGAETADVVRSEHSNNSLYTPDSVDAIAGNLTELDITGVSKTQAWQGYFGNVTGQIILADSSGFRFYDWSVAEPQGEVFTSVNDTITWTDINCAPISDDSAYRTNWYNFYGMIESDYDDINDTYNYTNHPEFHVGYTTLNNCQTTYTFINNASQHVDFPSVLLASDSNSTLIFTSILEDNTEGQRQGIVGYDGQNYDFQVLVAEDGHDADNQVTPYYFWLEIE
jgi:hypothetical protein